MPLPVGVKGVVRTTPTCLPKADANVTSLLTVPALALALAITAPISRAESVTWPNKSSLRIMCQGQAQGTGPHPGGAGRAGRLLRGDGPQDRGWVSTPLAPTGRASGHRLTNTSE